MSRSSKHEQYGLSLIDNVRLLLQSWEIVPLMYGSAGLEYLTGKPMQASDIDILIPGIFVRERWDEFKSVLKTAGYMLIDEHEHTFEKNSIHYSYARIEELQSFLCRFALDERSQLLYDQMQKC